MPTTSYRFLVLTPEGHRWLNGSGVHVATPTDRDDFVLLAGFDPPHWAGRPGLLPDLPGPLRERRPRRTTSLDGAWTYRGHAARRRSWDELPGSRPWRDGRVLRRRPRRASRRTSITSTDLGVNAVYLNPIFRTFSNHGYDIIDYDHVAEHLGGDEALVSLRRATRERDIRLILDIAPNHVGVEHPWFQAAQADPARRDRRPVRLPRTPRRVRVVAGCALPAQARLPERGPARGDVRRTGGRSCTRWLRPPFEVDGWRIDVANMLGRLGAGPARPRRRARDAGRGQGRLAGGVPHRRALVRRHRPAGGRPVGWRHGLRRVHAAGARLAARASSFKSHGVGTVVQGRAVDDGDVRRDADRVPRSDRVAGRAPPAEPPRQPRHGAHPHGPGRRRGAACGRHSACC